MNYLLCRPITSWQRQQVDAAIGNGLAGLLLWELGAFLARFRQADCDGLLLARYAATLATFACAKSAALNDQVPSPRFLRPVQAVILKVEASVHILIL